MTTAGYDSWPEELIETGLGTSSHFPHPKKKMQFNGYCNRYLRNPYGTTHRSGCSGSHHSGVCLSTSISCFIKVNFIRFSGRCLSISKYTITKNMMDEKGNLTDCHWFALRRSWGMALKYLKLLGTAVKMICMNPPPNPIPPSPANTLKNPEEWKMNYNSTANLRLNYKS